MKQLAGYPSQKPNEHCGIAACPSSDGHAVVQHQIGRLATVTGTEQPTATDSWIVDRFGAYGRACLMLAIFLVAVAVNRSALDPFGLPKLTVLWMFGLPAAAFFVVRAAERRVWMPWPSRLIVATSAFLAAFVVATVFSQARRLSVGGLSGRYGGLIPLLVFVMIMVLIVAFYWEQPERTTQLAWAISLGASAVAIYTVIQQAGLDPIPWYAPGGLSVEFPASTIGNSNFTGAFMAIALPLSLYLVATATPRRRPWLGLAFGLELLAVWYAQSRGAFLAAITGLAVVGWIGRDRVPRWVKVACVGAAAAMVISAVAVLWHPWSDEKPKVLDAKVARTSSIEGRLIYWAGAWRVFLEHPVVGTGPETFYASYPPHRRVATVSDGSEPSLTDKPHNVFLEYAANTGLLGLATYLSVVGMAIWYGVRRCRELRGNERLLLAAFVGMLVAYLTQAAVSIDVPPLAFSGWVAIGAIAVLADPVILRRREGSTVPSFHPAPRSPARARSAFAFRAGVVVLLVPLLGLGLRALRADINGGLGRPERAAQLNALQPAYPLNEGVTALMVAKATAEPDVKLRQLELSEARLKRVLDLQPDELSVLEGMTDLYTVWAGSVDPSRYRDAIIWWQRAVAHDPTNGPLRERFESWKTQMHERVAELEVEAAARPDDPAGWLRAAQGRAALGEPALARANLDRVLSLSPGHREAAEILAILPP